MSDSEREPIYVDTEADLTRWVGVDSDLMRALRSPQCAADLVRKDLDALLEYLVSTEKPLEKGLDKLVEAWIQRCAIQTNGFSGDHSSPQDQESALRQYVEKNDQVWPNQGGTGHAWSPNELLEKFDGQTLDIADLPATYGFWNALDLIGALKSGDEANATVDTEQQESVDEEAPATELFVPLMVVCDSQQASSKGTVGQVAMQTMPEGNAIYPDVFAIGLARMDTSSSDGFLKAIDRAWQVAGPGTGRFRWRLAPYGVPGEHDSHRRLCLPYFNERSGEAAFACLIWAASGVGPDGESLEGDTLDEYATVTAMLDENQLAGGETTLLPVAGIVEKAFAALRCGIDLLIVANGQLDGTCAGETSLRDQLHQYFLEQEDEEPQFADDSLTPGSGTFEVSTETLTLRIVECQTVGEAFEELIRSSRLRRYTAIKAQAIWDSQFYEIDDDGNPLEPVTPMETQ